MSPIPLGNKPQNEDSLDGVAPQSPPSVSGSAPKAPPPPAAKDQAKAGEGEASGGGGLRVSLMPSGKDEGPAADLRRLIVILLAVLIVETVLMGGAYLFLDRKVSAAELEYEAAVSELTNIAKEVSDTQKEAEMMIGFDNRVEVVNGLLDEHARWTKFFAFLERKTKPAVRYGGFSGDIMNASIVLQAQAPTYREVAEQIVALKSDPMVLELQSTSAFMQIDDDGTVSDVGFTMFIKMNPELWVGELTEEDKPAVEDVEDLPRGGTDPNEPIPPVD